MRAELGDEYVSTLRNCYDGSVAGGADLSVYWHERARAQIEAGKAKRAGLLATQGIRGGANQKTLKKILETGTIFEAWSDLKWTLKGAAVHISIVCQSKKTPTSVGATYMSPLPEGKKLEAQPAMANAGNPQPADGKRPAKRNKAAGAGKDEVGIAPPKRQPVSTGAKSAPDMAKMAMPLPLELESDARLDGVPVPGINADLTGADASDLTQAKSLAGSRGLCFIGNQKTGHFEITPEEAREMLRARGNPNGKPNSDVIFPWVNATDLTRRNRGFHIIYFGIECSQTEAAKYEAPFEFLQKHVFLDRSTNKEASLRDNWWIHARPRGELREALKPLKTRYIATPRVSKHRLFVWIGRDVVVDSATCGIAREDDYFFGVLHSVAHERWALGLGTQLREKESGFRYTPTTCFETFPFPQPSDAQRAAIAQAAKELNDLREAWLNPTGLSEAELKKRTLTNLYNERPTWLHNAHVKLDKAVLAAYGWGDLSPEDLHANEKPTRMKAEQELLKRLLALNLERAG
jgi:type II restriction/modification system DNA methylase subunit YeeA